MVYLITYDLNKVGQNYDDLHEAIKSLGDWAHAMASVWFVDSNKSANDICTSLQKVIDKNDYIFVSQVTKSHYGWLKSEICDWLNNRL